MKLLRHLLASAICVAAVVATSATPASAHAADVSYPSRQGETNLLRGPVTVRDNLPAPGDNYDKAEDFPSPEDSEDEPEVATEEEFESEIHPLIVPEEDDTELNDVLGYEIATGTEDETEHEEDTGHNFRQLRSVIDPTPVMLETVTGPAFPSEVPGSELMDPKPDLRGPEQEIEA